MKFNCGLSPEDRAKKLTQAIELRAESLVAGWPELVQKETMFAVLPKRVGAKDCRWLESVNKVYHIYTEEEVIEYYRWWSGRNADLRMSLEGLIRVDLNRGMSESNIPYWLPYKPKVTYEAIE